MPIPKPPCTVPKVQPYPSRHPISGSRFYLHEDDFGGLPDCFFQSLNVSSFDSIDERVPPNIASLLPAHWLTQLLRNHPQRTANEAQADWHFIGAPLHISYLAATQEAGSVDCGNANNNVSPESTPTCDAGKSAPWPASCQVCRGSRCLDTHLQRARSLANKLRASKSFGTGMTTYPDGRIRSFGNGSRYVLVNALWRNHEHTLGRELTSLLHHSWLPSVDPRFPRYGPQRRIARAPKPVTGPLLPYVASSLMDKYKTDEAMYLNDFMRNDTISVLFRGKLITDGRVNSRVRLKRLIKKVKDARVTHSKFESVSDYGRLARETASQYQQSSFCLIVQGDTPTTRRLYDALASGCVPIVMGDLALTLPFTSTVEWRKIIIYAGSLNCVTRDKVEESAAWLQRLVEYVRTNRDGGEELVEMRQKGQAAFRQWLSYRSNGLVDALLTELERPRWPVAVNRWNLP